MAAFVGCRSMNTASIAVPAASGLATSSAALVIATAQNGRRPLLSPVKVKTSASTGTQKMSKDDRSVTGLPYYLEVKCLGCKQVFRVRYMRYGAAEFTGFDCACGYKTKTPQPVEYFRISRTSQELS